ncbi:MAG TPA: hypothetical protein VG276_08445 [Actinomycetes bacterium]|nr:hypothetical protein [Actinomycetes bacterium]
MEPADQPAVEEPTATIYDTQPDPEAKVDVRRLPQLVRHGLRILSADRIYVLGDGRVLETVTHEELLRRGQTYAELFTLHAAAYLEAAQPEDR